MTDVVTIKRNRAVTSIGRGATSDVSKTFFYKESPAHTVAVLARAIQKGTQIAPQRRDRVPNITSSKADLSSVLRRRPNRSV